MERESESEPARKSPRNLGRFYEGTWYCDCAEDNLAIHKPAGEATQNPGKWFWRCPKSRDEECGFFLWDKDEARRKALLAGFPVQSSPKTPMSTKRTRPDDPVLTKSSGNPWSRAKRNLDPKVVPEENEGGSPSDRIVADETDEELEYMNTPSKAAKTTSVSTPHGRVRESARTATQSLPTRRTGKQPIGIGTASGSRTRDGTSPSLDPLQHETGLGNETRPSLTNTVLNLIDSENIRLKETTLFKIRLEIDLELDQHKAKVQQYQKTISQLLEKNEYWKSIAMQDRGDV